MGETGIHKLVTERNIYLTLSEVSLPGKFLLPGRTPNFTFQYQSKTSHEKPETQGEEEES